MLLFLQCSASSFYDPARRALTPTIVSARDLPLATTLDSFAWSLVGALGASLGGIAVRCPGLHGSISKLGALGTSLGGIAVQCWVCMTRFLS